MLDSCWPTVCDAGPAWAQHWVNVSCLLGCRVGHFMIHGRSDRTGRVRHIGTQGWPSSAGGLERHVTSGMSSYQIAMRIPFVIARILRSGHRYRSPARLNRDACTRNNDVAGKLSWSPPPPKPRQNWAFSEQIYLKLSVFPGLNGMRIVFLSYQLPPEGLLQIHQHPWRTRNHFGCEILIHRIKRVKLCCVILWKAL